MIRIFLSVLILAFAINAHGEPVTILIDNGPSENRVDIAFVGDGYMELDKYKTDVEKAVTGFFNQEPFREYKNAFNVRRIDVVSNGVIDSGDTAFGARYVGRGIVVDRLSVETVINRSAEPNQLDVLLYLSIVTGTEEWPREDLRYRLQGRKW